MRAELVAELRGHYLVDFKGCPYAGRADLLEAGEPFEFPQRWIDREHWLSRNPDQHIECGADGVLRIPERLDELPQRPIYPKPTR